MSGEDGRTTFASSASAGRIVSAPSELIGRSAAVMAALASVLCLATPGLGLVGEPWVFVGLGVGLVAHRWWWERRLARGARGAGPLFAGHTAASYALVALHPLYGVYTFAGYLDAARVFTGRRLLVAVVAVAGTSALSQVGGVRGEWANPALFGVLVVVNATIAGTMTRIEQRREGEAAERVRTAERLLVAERENAALHARLAERAREAGVLAERARLSREIHDTVAQGLVGVIRQLEAIDARGPEREWRTRIDRADQAARDALGEARRAVAALASPRLDEHDLPGALDRLVATWSEESGVAGEAIVDGPSRPGAHDAAVLRICQEALANVARHAGATRARVTLAYGPREVRLDVRDDGRGFDPAAAGGGHGLDGVRERVREAGGTLDIETGPGAGCAISVEVPL